MRLGILGGSYDPPHVGHLLVAQDAVAALSLDRLLVVPAAQQPLKRVQYAPAGDRLAMAQRTFQSVPGVVVDPIEIDRGGLSFMVDTVETLQRRWPLAELHLLIGEDAFASFSAWREPERLRSMARVVVVRRPGAVIAGAEITEQRDEPGFPVQHLASRLVDVSSTEIRERVRTRRSIRGFVTDGVADYIASTGLYLRDPEAADVAARA